jgi:3-dehydroquinate synthase
VVVDPDVLSTLPEREFRSGLFEAMKYGVIRNPAIFDLMEQHREAILKRDSKLLEDLIVECIRIKADIVSGDEREGGERRILNFGHTVGHALEAETGYKKLLHGEAVGWGMIAAAAIGERMQITSRETAQRIVDLVRAYGPLPKVHVNAKRVFERLLSDKKTVAGVPHFILATEIGKVKVVNNVERQYVIDAVKDFSRSAKGFR